MKKMIFVFCIFAGMAAMAGASEDLLWPYKTIQTELAADSVKKVPEAAAAMEIAAQGAVKESKNQQAIAHAKKIQNSAAKLKSADLKTARSIFKDLSVTLIEYQRATGKTVPVFHCSMIDGYWIQEGSTPANPYYGKEMLECGEKVDSSKVKSSK